MATATRKPEPRTSRVVVLMPVSERRRVGKIAAAQKISLGEYVRRRISADLPAKQAPDEQENQLLQSLVTMLTASLAEVNQSVAQTCDKLDALHLTLQTQEQR